MDHALEKSQQVKSNFVGKVGELQSAGSVMAGSHLLRLAEKIPQVDSTDPLSPKMMAFFQVAALTSGVMMGAVAAPVLGPLAILGGALTGLGAWIAGKKAAEEAQKGVSILPGYLDSLGARLGAKREATLSAPEPRSNPGPWSGVSPSV
jgi:hypothetical protein